MYQIAVKPEDVEIKLAKDGTLTVSWEKREGTYYEAHTHYRVRQIHVGPHGYIHFTTALPRV